MPNTSGAWQEQLPLAHYLVQRVCDSASGRAEEECLRNYPRDKYFIGSLRPISPDEEPEEAAHTDRDMNEEEEEADDDTPSPFLAELRQKLAPVAFGADFGVLPVENEVSITVELAWSCYYKIFPTRQQQIDWQQLERSSTARPAAEAAQTAAESPNAPAASLASESPAPPSPAVPQPRQRVPTEDLCPRFRKIDCATRGIITVRRAGDNWTVDTLSLDSAITQELERVARIAAENPDRFRANTSPDEKVRIAVDRLADDARFSDFLSTLRVEINPAWRWRVHVSARVVENGEWLVSLQFANRSPATADLLNQEGFLFDTRAAFVFTKGDPRPFELATIPRGFRYDRRMWGRGFNCALRHRDESGVRRFETTHAPVFVQNRYQTRTDPPAPFVGLSSNPIPILTRISDEMQAYLAAWEQERVRYAAAHPNWAEIYEAQFNEDLELFRDEIARFQQGMALIHSDADVRLAFQLTNETFSRGSHGSWRLFQLVFLVSQIPGIASLSASHVAYAAERRKVDIIYFPTGGGKTEAYLGVITFHCFYDRLRGKKGGVTAWTRFPLRLLTLQQTQRAADVIGIAELVRRHHADRRLSGPDIDGFAVGYFVGEGGSPNEIVPPDPRGGSASPVWSQVNDPEARQQWKRVVTCPSCGRNSTVVVDFDAQTFRLLHRCTNQACQFPNGILPIYIVDNDIYRYLPSLIVGTIDKLAGLGNQRKMSMLFGAVDGTCPRHGYLKLICCQKNCEHKAQWQRGVKSGISGVTLFVQDELHLLKEGLGTFDSHYETFAQRIRQEFSHTDDLKIIASSATIEAFERQVQHLYGRTRADARRFPGPGPNAGSSFYAQTLDHAQRLFVGLIPHNKTILNSILELMELYHRILIACQRVQPGAASPYGGTLQTGSPEYGALLDLYSTSLTYFLSNRHLNEVRTDIDGDVNGSMRNAGYPELNCIELTGHISTDEVANSLAHLQRPAAAGQSPDAVLATSMISHGVDVDRFNAMLFYGMPRLNAEYIQASSRVGRSHIGIVFDCFHPVRERDQSHYAYFDKYHEYLGQLVEPVAINRWSRFSIQRTMPGIFMGVLLQLIANRVAQGNNPNKFYMREHVVQQIVSQALTSGNFTPVLQQAYHVQGATDPALAAFAAEISQQVDSFLFDQIAGSGSSATFVSEVLIPQPMRSLRDVDEPIEIELDSYGTDWANRIANRTGGT